MLPCCYGDKYPARSIEVEKQDGKTFAQKTSMRACGEKQFEQQIAMKGVLQEERWTVKQKNRRQEYINISLASVKKDVVLEYS